VGWGVKGASLAMCECFCSGLYKGWDTPEVSLLISFNSLLIKKE